MQTEVEAICPRHLKVLELQFLPRKSELQL